MREEDFFFFELFFLCFIDKGYLSTERLAGEINKLGNQKGLIFFILN